LQIRGQRPRAAGWFVESIIHEAAAAPIDVTSSLTCAEVPWPDASRRLAFESWLASIERRHGLQAASLRPASSDASFRRYLRIADAGGRSFIVMDAPPTQEDVRPFIAVAGLLESAGLNAPRVLESDVGQGFLLLTDLGSQLYLQALQEAVARGDFAHTDRLMRAAIAALLQWQTRADASALPPYDDGMLRRELALFPEWCVGRELGAVWTADEQQQWQAACDLLVGSALAQASLAVHLDYMPRNLMVCEPNPGILDFQDAVRGPIAYDMASLLRDAFISWDEELELD
jgi:N-acetylmuramate 1-kinase